MTTDSDMTKEQALEIITQFEDQCDDSFITRKEAISVMTAMNVFMLNQISEFLMTDYKNSQTGNNLKHKKNLSKKRRF